MLSADMAMTATLADITLMLVTGMIFSLKHASEALVLVVLGAVGGVVGHYLFDGLLGLDLIQLEDDTAAAIQCEFTDVLITPIGKHLQGATTMKGIDQYLANEIVLLSNATHLCPSTPWGVERRT